MVQIQIAQGQGITQAIKAKVQSDGGKIANNNQSIWTEVMSEVKTAQQNGQTSSTINGKQQNYAYTGGDDINQLNNKSNWQTDFKVVEGQVIELADNVWNNIVNLLTGKTPETNTKTETPAAAEKTIPQDNVQQKQVTEQASVTQQSAEQTPTQTSVTQQPAEQTPKQPAVTQQSVEETTIQTTATSPSVDKTTVNNSKKVPKGIPQRLADMPFKSPIQKLKCGYPVDKSKADQVVKQDDNTYFKYDETGHVTKVYNTEYNATIDRPVEQFIYDSNGTVNFYNKYEYNGKGQIILSEGATIYPEGSDGTYSRTLFGKKNTSTIYYNSDGSIKLYEKSSPGISYYDTQNGGGVKTFVTKVIQPTFYDENGDLTHKGYLSLR